MNTLVPILRLVAVNGVVSFALAAFCRSRFLVIAASVLVTELLFLIVAYQGVAASSDAPEIVNVPLGIAVASMPIVALMSAIFVKLAEWFRQRFLKETLR